MDRTAAKNLLRLTFENLKKIHTELGAYKMAVAALKAMLEHDYPGFSALADGVLTASRQSPSLHETMRKQYDEPLEKYLEQVSQAETEEEVEKLLQAMPPSKFEN